MHRTVKEAPAMEFEQVLSLRQSTRSFTDRPVPSEELEIILRAGQRAPLAAGDDRTTHLTLIGPGETLERIRAACRLKRKNGETVDAFYGAQALIVVSATDLSEDAIEYANAGCVIENMHLQAAALGLGSCYIWGSLRKLRADARALSLLRLPEGYSVLSALAVGYPAKELSTREYAPKMKVTIL